MGVTDTIAGFVANTPFLDEFYPDKVTLQDAPNKTYTNVTGATLQPSRILPVNRMQSGERKEWAISIGATHTIQFRAYLPMAASNMRAVCGDKTYEILREGIDHPSKMFTLIAVRATGKTA